MATSPEVVRSGLQRVTGGAVADLQQVAATASSPRQLRDLLFYAAPLIASDYADGSSALALDWYEETRSESGADRPFTPTLVNPVTEDSVSAMVAFATVDLIDPDKDYDLARRTSIKLVSDNVQKFTASGFWDTMTTNSVADPNAKGWRRYARSGACKFCVMIADRGAVFRQKTATFAAHKKCHCLAGPEFDPSAPLANAQQELAASRYRSPAQKAQLRSYLNSNYPDSPG